MQIFLTDDGLEEVVWHASISNVTIWLDANIVDNVVAEDSSLAVLEHGDIVRNLDERGGPMRVELMFIGHAVFALSVLYPDPRGASVEDHFELFFFGAYPNIGVELNIEECVQVLLDVFHILWALGKLRL